ncbi:MAG: hypothetical protein MUE56_00445 [Ignavibacteria bacterium]|jgi:N-acetylglucosamine kinase-like BadF-type ATPase|nr:hypothetical protein [Ignavibacteria bacterium]
MKKGDYFILIDSGGTNCRIASSIDSVNLINASVFPSVHFSSKGLAEFSAHVSEIIKNFTSEHGLSCSECAGICIGAAGARDYGQKNAISGEICRSTGIKNVIVESDSAIAFESYFGTGDGLLMICGTGSVLFGKSGGSDIRIGGWGKLLGDTGSSYSLSIYVLRGLTREFDITVENTEIESLLEKEYGINRHTIINEIYHKNFDIAGLAPLFLDLAGKGNELCRNAVENEIKGIADLINILLNKNIINDRIDLAFTGGLVEGKNYFSGRLFELLENNFREKINIITEFKNPLEGALKIAARRIAG